jgi:N-acetylglutamate synthase/N-acetylornithine aminotransferase
MHRTLLRTRMPTRSHRVYRRLRSSRQHFMARMPSLCLPHSFVLHAILTFFSWGRVLSAAGSASVSKPLDPKTVSVSFVPSDGTAPLSVLVNGEPENVDEDRASQILQLEDFEVIVDLGAVGKEQAQYYTCDFSYVSSSHSLTTFFMTLAFQEYVRINGDYRS